MTDNYNVGYGKPPTKNQFNPGRSGNPKGRPKGKGKTLTHALDAYLSEHITVRENGISKKLTILDAYIRRLVTDALKGKAAATRILHKEIEKIDIQKDKASVEPLTVRFAWKDKEIVTKKMKI